MKRAHRTLWIRVLRPPFYFVYKCIVIGDPEVGIPLTGLTLPEDGFPML
jgi:hypothetical protein